MTPLTLKQRKTMLFVLILIFLIVGPWLVVRSFGWQLGDKFSFIKTGGIYVHSDIANAEVYIDGKFEEKNGTLIRNLLVDNLKPGQTYHVEFIKEGYRPWIKDIYVYPSLVSEARVLMLPEEIIIDRIFPFFDGDGVGTTTPATTTPKTLSGVYIPQNKDYIETVVLFDGDNPFADEDDASSSIFSLFNNSETDATTTIEQETPQYLLDLGVDDFNSLENFIETSREVSWLEGGNIVLHWIGKEESVPYFYCTGNKERVCGTEIVLDWANDIEKFEYFPGRDDVWLVLVGNQLFAVEIDARGQRNIQFIYEGDRLNFVKNDSDKVIVRDGGQFFELEL